MIARPSEVVVVSYYFPPLRGMGSLRMRRFATALPETGWRPRILTVRDGRHPRLPEEWAAPQELDVVRSRSLEPSSRPPAGAGWTAPAGREGVGRRLARGLVRNLVYVPDARVGWYPYAVAAGHRMLRSPGPRRVLYSTSVPFTAHLVAARLAARHRLPWVAEFRDLWVGGQGWDAVPAPRQAVDRRIEGWIVGRADHLILTTGQARASLLARYPTLDPDRVHVVTNAWEARDGLSWSPPDPGAPFELVHPGTLAEDGSQDPTPLVEAVSQLWAERPGGLVLRVLGPEEPWATCAAGVGLPQAALRLDGWVPADRVAAVLARSSALVMLAPGPAYRPVLLGKVFDWLGIRMPALAVSESGGATAELAARAGGCEVVPRNEVPLLVAALRRLLGRQESGSLADFVPDSAVVRHHSLAETTRRLAEILERASAGAVR